MSESFNVNKPHDPFDALHASIHRYIDAKTEQTRKKETTIINRLVDRIKDTFKPQKKEDPLPHLTGRIQEVHFNAGLVLDNLRTMKEELRAEINPALADAIMDPMISQLSRVVTDVNSPVTQPGRYAEWIEKAKMWVQLYSTTHNKDELSQAIIEYTFKEFCGRIDKDLQVVRDYAEHSLQSAPLDEKQKETIKNEIDKKIRPFFESLVSLKTTPPQVELDQLRVWQDNADRRRDKYFNSILQVIDGMVAEYSPKVYLEEEYEHLLEILDDYAFLESEVPSVCNKVLEAKDKSEYDSSINMERIVGLQQSLQDLYLDIRMPPKIVEQLQHLKDQVAQAIEKYNLDHG